MSKAKTSKSAKGPKPMTISAFAMQIGADRRTITRRILARRIEPVGKRGLYDLYDIDDLAAVTADIDQPQVQRRASRLRCDEDGSEYECGLEHGRDGAILSVGEELPGLIELLVKRFGAQLDKGQLDKLVYDTWIALAERIEGDQSETPSGSFLEFLQTEAIFEHPDAMQPIVWRLAIKPAPEGAELGWLPKVQNKPEPIAQ